MANGATNSTNGETKKRFRSPPYPSIDLKSAIDRARQVYTKALHHAVGIQVLGEAWSLKESSSGLWSMAAALLHFRLLKDDGIGDKRKFQLTDSALRIIKDTDPQSQKRREAVQNAALAPAIHRELWGKFGEANDISDFVLKTYLTLDRKDEGKAPFSDDAADDLIKEYKATISFAQLSKDTISLLDEVKEENSNKSTTLEESNLAGVGDLVQVEISGSYQLEQPKRIRAVQDYEGATWAFIDGSETGVPMEQIRVIEKASGDPAKPPQGAAPILPLPPPDPSAAVAKGEREWLRGPLSKGTSYRLIVSGDLGPKEIGKLIKLLEAQKEVLADDDSELAELLS
jgi:hypothetical protein